MMKNNILRSQKGALDLVVGILLLGLIVIAGVYFYYQHQTQLAAQKAVQSNSQAKSIQLTKPDTNQAKSTSSETSPFVYHVKMLQLKFTAPGKFSDLIDEVKYRSGDQAVNAVAFSSKRLSDAGCSTQDAPLGILAYDQKSPGAEQVSPGSHWYFSPPQQACGKADSSLQDWKSLQSALKTVTDDR